MSRPHATIRPPPPPHPSQSQIEKTIELTPLPILGPNIFTNTRPLWHPPGARGVYGGAVIAQSLLAAEKTVPEGLVVHSMHCYFVLSGDPDSPIIYHVEDVRPGGNARSFATREIKAKQNGKIIFIALASFQRKNVKGNGKDVPGHEIPMPTKDDGIPEPEEVQSGDERAINIEKELEKLRVSIEERRRKKETGKEDPSLSSDELSYHESMEAFNNFKQSTLADPFIWKSVRGFFPRHHQGSASPPSIHSRKTYKWLTSRDVIHGTSASTKTLDITFNQLAALAYLSDSLFLATMSKVNPQLASKNIGMMVSLDHTIYFHLGEDTKVDAGEWLLVETDSPWVGEERALVTQRVWRKSDGRLVATCIQEGLVRLKDGKRTDDGNKAASEGIRAGITKRSHKL